MIQHVSNRSRVMNADKAGAAGDVSTGGAFSKATMGKDEFIKLLVAQMQHQDPLNPSDGQQMAAQLAQFSSLEQLMNINSALSTQSAASTSLANSFSGATAIGLIGKTVTSAQNAVQAGGGAPLPMEADVASAGTLTARLVDSTGKTVRTISLGGVKAGRASVPVDSLTAGVPPGNYTVALDLTGAGGAVTHPATLVRARVDGVLYGPNGPVLKSGTRTFSLSSITSVDLDS